MIIDTTAKPKNAQRRKPINILKLPISDEFIYGLSILAPYIDYVQILGERCYWVCCREEVLDFAEETLLIYGWTKEEEGIFAQPVWTFEF